MSKINYYQCCYCGRIFRGETTPNVPHNCRDGFRKHNQEYTLLKVLHLPLRANWYNMIESGEKQEEYREIKPYWIKRLTACKGENRAEKTGFYCKKANCWSCLTRGEGFHPEKYTHVCFSYGYTRRTMTFPLESMTIGRGRPEWGAPEEMVFILKLGKKLSPYRKR